VGKYSAHKEMNLMSIDAAIAEALAKLDSQTGNDQSDETTEADEAAVEPTDDSTVTGDDTLAEGESAADDDEDSEGDEDEASEIIELSADAVVRIDGKEGTVRELLELKADYTRKTQALAAERTQVEAREVEIEQVYTQMRDWYSERVDNPIAWVAEIAEASGDATALLAGAIKAMADEGMLDPEFIEAFGLSASDHPVRKNAARSTVDPKVAELERKIAEREEREAVEARQRDLFAEYERQVQNVISDEGLAFDTEADLQQFRIELFTFAKENGIVDNLEVAYAVMARQRDKAERAKQAKLAETAAKKRKTQVIAKTAGTPQSAPTPKAETGDYADVARSVLARMEQTGRS
jgi:hypothetical protein